MRRLVGALSNLHPFTPVEDDLIRQLFPTGGSVACAAVMPNRTRASIKFRARRIGAKYVPKVELRERAPWSPDPLNVTADAWRGPVDKGITTWRIAA